MTTTVTGGGFVHQLRAALEREIREATMAAGTKAEDWGDYERRRGRVSGLKDALGIFEREVEKFFTEEERDV